MSTIPDKQREYLFAPMPTLPADPMSDQEIRARALECAVLFCGLPAVPAEDTNLMVVAQQFETYIRDGVT